MWANPWPYDVPNFFLKNIDENGTPSYNSWTFFGQMASQTNRDGAHVTVGIIWLLSLWGLATRSRLGQRDAEKVEIAGLYWHFVDVVWIVIFTLVYLIPQPK